MEETTKLTQCHHSFVTRYRVMRYISLHIPLSMQQMRRFWGFLLLSLWSNSWRFFHTRHFSTTYPGELNNDDIGLIRCLITLMYVMYMYVWVKNMQTCNCFCTVVNSWWPLMRQGWTIKHLVGVVRIFALGIVVLHFLRSVLFFWDSSNTFFQFGPHPPPHQMINGRTLSLTWSLTLNGCMEPEMVTRKLHYVGP